MPLKLGGRRKKEIVRREVFITPQTIKQVFQLYCQDWSQEAIAKDLDLPRSTVHRLIKQGDPKNGIEPLEVRRSRLMQAVMETQEQELVQKWSAHSKLASAGFATAAGRMVKRFQAAASLDNAEELAPRARQLAEKIALEPGLDDVKTFHNVFKDTIQQISAMRSAPAPNVPLVSITNANTANQQSNFVTSDDAYTLLDRLTENNDTLAPKVADIVKEKSLQMEASEIAARVRQQKEVEQHDE